MIKPGWQKRLVILSWFFATSLFLWYVFLIIKPEFEFIQFFYFCVLLVGGSFAFQEMIHLIDHPFVDSQSDLWLSILARLGDVFVGFFIIGISLYILLKLNIPASRTISSFYVIIGILWALKSLFSTHEAIGKLLSSNNKPQRS